VPDAFDQCGLPVIHLTAKASAAADLNPDSISFAQASS